MRLHRGRPFATRAFAAALAAACVVLFLASCDLGGAAADERRAALGDQPYTVSDWKGCGAGYNAGSWDDNGRLYVPCGNPSTILVYGLDGELQRQIPLAFYAYDVAPSPDGRYLYVATGSETPRRLNLQADGSYRPDSSGWALKPYSFGGRSYTARGLFIASDSAGNVYLSDGAWSGSDTHVVTKYRPDGTVAAPSFGGWANSWNTGTFYWMLTGLTVSRDGSKVFTTEVGNNRVQRWDRQGDGSYAFASSFGSTAQNNPDRSGACNFNGWEGKFAAPYDVALDRDGDLYVMNTTCHQLLKFTSGGGYLAGWKLGSDATSERPHGFAVAANGDVLIGQSGKKVTRSGGAYPVASSGTEPDPEPEPKPEPKPGPAPPHPDPPVDPCVVQPASCGAASLNVAAQPLQRIARAGVRVTVSCNVLCDASVEGTVIGAGPHRRLEGVTLRLRADRGKTARAVLSATGLRAVRRTLRRGRRVTATVTVVATRGSDGKPVDRQRRRIRLR